MSNETTRLSESAWIKEAADYLLYYVPSWDLEGRLHYAGKLYEGYSEMPTIYHTPDEAVTEDVSYWD